MFAGYIASWVAQRPAPCALSLATLDPTKYTHLIIPFAGFDTTNFVLTAMNNDAASGWYNAVLGLKSRNANLKVFERTTREEEKEEKRKKINTRADITGQVLISVGGGEFGTAPFTTMVSTATKRAKFITNAISFARAHK